MRLIENENGYEVRDYDGEEIVIEFNEKFKDPVDIDMRTGYIKIFANNKTKVELSREYYRLYIYTQSERIKDLPSGEYNEIRVTTRIERKENICITSSGVNILDGREETRKRLKDGFGKTVWIRDENTLRFILNDPPLISFPEIMPMTDISDIKDDRVNNSNHTLYGYDKRETFLTISFKKEYRSVTVNKVNMGIQINAPHEYDILLNLLNCESCEKDKITIGGFERNNGSNKDLTLVLKLDLNETITLNSAFLTHVEFPESIYKEITDKYNKMESLKLREHNRYWAKEFDIINNGNGDIIFLCDESDIDKYKSINS